MMMKYRFASVSLYIRLISVYANSLPQEELDNPLSRVKKESMPIELHKFLEPAMLLPPTGDFCWISCPNISSAEYFIGKYVECQTFSSNNLGEYCEVSPDLTWAMDGNGEVYGHDTDCTIPEPAAGNGCESCLCIREGRKNLDNEPVRSFSLRPQVSDVGNNMVVTGLMFKLENKMIHLKIKESKLLTDGSVSSESSWKDLDDIVEKSSQYGPYNWPELYVDEDYVSFTPDQRTLFLDNILIPQGYVVTGVKFALVNTATGHSGLKIQVKGSKVEYPSHKLTDDPNEWFDDEYNCYKDASYNRPRKEINLLNLDRPQPVSEGNKISDTNRFIVFRTTDLKKDLGNHVIPYLIDEPTESNDPLQGIGLSYRHVEGFGGYVTLEVFPSQPSKSSASDEVCKTSTEDFMTDGFTTISTGVYPKIDLTQLDLPVL